MIAEYIGASTAFLIGAWVYNDAKKRGLTKFKSGLWWFSVFMALIIFLPLWFLLRPKNNPITVEKTENPWHLCMHCQRYIQGTPDECPKCGGTLNTGLKAF